MDTCGTRCHDYGSIHTCFVSPVLLCSKRCASLCGLILIVRRRMLYRELKSSQRSYFRSRSGTARYNVENTQPEHKSKRGTLYGHNHHGQNSVIIMSTTGWQESQEALQDSDGSRTQMAPTPDGITKTEEVNIEHQRLSRVSGNDSLEMKPVQPAYEKAEHRGNGI